MVQALSIFVTFIAAMVFGFLAHRSPKRDWEFFQGWPGVVLLLISTAAWQVEFYNNQPSITGEVRLTCETLVNELGIEYQDCEYTSARNENYEQERAAYSIQSLKDWFLGGFVSILLDIPLEFVGAWIGMRLARKGGR